MLSARLNRTHVSPAEGRRRAGVYQSLQYLGVGLVCGALVAFSIPPFGFWLLAWLGFAGLAAFLPGRSMAEKALLGFGAGLGQFAIGLAWVSEFSIPGCVALIVVSAIFVCAAVLIVPSRGWASVVVGLPAAFVLSDWLRARFPLGGFPLGGVALGQALSPTVPAVRLGGGLLLTGETVLVGVLLAQVFRSALALRGPSSVAGPELSSRTLLKDAIGVVAIAAIAVAIPIAGWLSPSGSGVHHSTLRVALVQGGGERGTRAIHTDPEVVFQRHLSAAAGIHPPVDLVVMPEGILQTDQAFTSTVDADQIVALAERLDSTVIAGVEQDVGSKHYLNEVAAWSSSGSVVSVYLKNHRVPFGEYIPWRSFISRFFNVSEVPLDAIAGHSPGYMTTPAAPLGVMISYEVFFDERARGGVQGGGQVLVVPTNTASYRSSQVPTQELAAARLRAWETGRWVLQVTPTGYTAVITPSGKVVVRSALGHRAVVQAVVQRETGRTVYVDIGDSAFAIGALLLLLGSALLAQPRWPGSDLPRGVRRHSGSRV
ncbi:MAG TPA: apolipoprotein N-acyltransferase [Acidimicrobiales bacterium]|nr:apolipoprotein N-acyltransferase [Acidimicrobiales bacterium]